MSNVPQSISHRFQHFLEVLLHISQALCIQSPLDFTDVVGDNTSPSPTCQEYQPSTQQECSPKVHLECWMRNSQESGSRTFPVTLKQTPSVFFLLTANLWEQ